MLKSKPENRKWWILLAMTSCISMIFLDITVLPVALPTIHRDLALSDLGIQWVVNGYILALTLFVIAGGRIGDRWGHKKTFLVGLLIFSLGSGLCGASQSQFSLVLFRLFQGVGAALLIPNALAIIFRAFPITQRGKAMGFYVSVGSIFLALGPFIGGIFSEYFNWRLIFFINIPIAVIGLMLTLYAVPYTEPKHRHYDYMGFFLATLGICCLVIPLMMAKAWGWTSFLTLGTIGFGVILTFFLILFDRKIEDPYINFHFFKNRQFTGAVIAMFSTQFLLMITVFWAIYFQNVFGYTPAQAGLISFTAHIPIILIAPIAGHVVDKHGPRIPVTIGFFLVVVSLFWFIQDIDNPSIKRLLSAIIPFGCGIPLIFTPSLTNALNTVHDEKRGLASGTLMMLRQFGGTVGLAVIASLFFSIQGNHFASDLKMHTETANLNPAQFHGLLDKNQEVQTALSTFSKQTQTYITKSYTESYIEAFWSINALAAVIAIVALIATLCFIRRQSSSQP